jgi:molybdopterin molybdotransferase
MDGFAVNSKRLKSFPARLRVAATVYAGDEVSSTNDNAESIKVMTGAVVPDAFDTVVPIEDVEYAEPFVTLSSEPKAGQHIRMPGEDVAKAG